MKAKNIKKTKHRHPTKNKGRKPTHLPTSISIGKKERALLNYMLEEKNSRFNIRGYHNLTNTPRSTIYDMLNRLISLELVNKIHIGNYAITDKGETTVNISSGDVGSVRKECRDNLNLSLHFTKYNIEIKSKDKFLISNLNKLNPINKKTLNLKNLEQHYLYFNDATIIINPKKVIIRIHDVVGKDSDEAVLISFNKAISYIEKLKTTGLELKEAIILDPNHYARVDSVLAHFLSKIDDRYFLDLGNGDKFWIDNSNTGNKKNIEDETNSKVVRDRLDTWLNDALINSDALMSDIDKQKEIIGELIKLRLIDLKVERDSKTPGNLPGFNNKITKGDNNFLGLG